MTTHATGTLEVTGWDEKPYSAEGIFPKFTRAKISQAFHGDIEGEGTAETIMVYPDNDSATYVGLRPVTARLGGRSGSFVIRENGTFEGGIATTSWVIVPGTGTGELRGLRGKGEYISKHNDPHIPYTLDYDFEAGL